MPRGKKLQTLNQHRKESHAAEWPREWIVEYVGSGKAKPVELSRTMFGPLVSRGKKKSDVPEWIRFEFKPIRAKAITIRPAGEESAEGLVVKSVDVYRKKK